jgi:hypothetical protein
VYARLAWIRWRYENGPVWWGKWGYNSGCIIRPILVGKLIDECQSTVSRWGNISIVLEVIEYKGERRISDSIAIVWNLWSNDLYIVHCD